LCVHSLLIASRAHHALTLPQVAPGLNIVSASNKDDGAFALCP
jgi:hypothetical protein